MQCTYTRKGGQCVQLSSKNNLCTFHLSGGKTLHPDLYYRSDTKTWVRSSEVSPKKGDIKITHHGFYTYVSNWRKQCKVCTRFARPTYCASHESDSSLMKKRKTCTAYSKASCMFMDQLSQVWGKEIQHLHLDDYDHTIGSEFCIPCTTFKVDGYIANDNVVVEFLGDFWHGNPDCYESFSIHPVFKITYYDLLEKTFKRFEAIRSLGYRIFYIWEKEYDRSLSSEQLLDKLQEWTGH